MNAQSDKGTRVFKGLPRIRWAKDEDETIELNAARNSFYFWWWTFLRESVDYRRALSGKSLEPFTSMAKDFGRLGDNFDSWWLRTGRDVFSEQLALPKVRTLSHGDMVNLKQINAKLVVELPLTIRRTTILKQLNKLLDQHHDGTKLRIHKHGTARRKLYADSRMRLPTLKLLYDVWMARKVLTGLDWHEIGAALKISPAFIPSATDSEYELAYKKRCITLVVQRHYRKASALIAFAAQGDFPRIK